MAMREDSIPNEQPCNTSDPAPGVDPAATLVERVPVEPLPSGQMLLAALAGIMPVTATDILDPAFDLVACHRQYRLALDVLGSGTTSAERLTAAAADVVAAQMDIGMLVTVIDTAITDRLLQRRKDQCDQTETSAVEGCRDVVVHTESLGQIAARMADLWDRLIAAGSQRDELAHADQLCALCDAYDMLVAEIESGRRLPFGL
jgi:hypothetical protein